MVCLYPTHRIAAAIAGLFALTLPASAAHACLREVALNAQLVADARAYPMQGFAGDAHTPAFLIGHLSYLREAAQAGEEEGVHGAVLFIERGGSWRAFLPEAGETALAAYVSKAAPLVLIVTHLQIEGPGQSFTIMRSTDGLRSAECAPLAFPKALNRDGWKSEYLELHSLQMNARGKGRLIGSAQLGADTARPKTRWWRYRTRSGAKRWSRPHALDGARAPKPGVLTLVQSEAPPAMIASLASFTQAR